MTKYAISIILAVLMFGLVRPAHAYNLTFVSSKGSDSGGCNHEGQPCRGLNRALLMTDPGGEIRVLDAGRYWSGNLSQLVTVIDKGVTIVGPEGAAMVDDIIINAPADAVVNLVNLEIRAVVAPDGLLFASGARLTMKNCAIRRFARFGIYIATGATYLLEDVVVSRNILSNDAANGWGVTIWGANATKIADGVLRRVSVIGNRLGVRLVFAKAVVSDSVFANNVNEGILVGASGGNGGAVLAIDHSTVSRNDIGVRTLTGSQAFSSGDNFIFSNRQDVVGVLTTAPKR